MNEWHRLTAVEAARRLARRELSAEALLRSCLERIAAREPEVRAFAHLDADAALAQARALDAGPLRGLLHGLPLGVKDILDTADQPTACGTPIYAGHRPPADAAPVALARGAGAVIAGKTVTTELANMTAGVTRHPLNPAHSPGGSSSGSAAAVADFMLPLALGTQTAGSIVRPAAYCGVVGFKPSFGRAPRAGVKPNAESMDVVGGFGRTVEDAALLAAVLLGDRRALDEPVPETFRLGLAPGPDRDHAADDVIACWQQAVRVLAPRLARCEDAALPADVADIAALQGALQAHETALSLAHEHRVHRERLSPALLELLDRGAALDAVQVEALRARAARWRSDVDTLFERFDVLLAPSTRDTAPAGLAFTGDPLYCRPWSLLGLPCVHLPFARGANGLPVGLQLVGRKGEDHRVLAAAKRAMAWLG
ncbi:MAG: amidase [Piscinibacter sp.]|uniref:amidase n=1 Tax=Piscinibacter TaxID=1114981 RepID=UPI000FDE0EE3|nr:MULTISPECIES: amidase [Piscinibacter]MCW5667788.1 amidase [Piscinibacter sp.]